MADEKLLTVREVALILGVSEKEVLELAEKGKIPAYKVGGVYLRFKKEQVYSYQRSSPSLSYKKEMAQNYPLRDRLSDFFYFNDFYILAGLIIIALLLVIFRG
jgi:excisionase family DNA binding protein